MPRIKDDHVVEQISTTVSDPTLCSSVLPRASEAGPHRLDFKAFHRIDHFVIEMSATIKDQELWSRIEWERLAKLLDDPSTTRMLCYVAMEDTPPVMRDDEETVEYAENQRRQGEEVHRGDGFAMVAEKGCPSLRQLRTPWHSPHPAQHGSFRDIEAEHFQLAMNARRAPSSVLGDHSEDDLAQFSADALPACPSLMPRDPRPIQFETGSVPSRNRLRLDKNQRLFPSTPDSAQYRPKRSVRTGRSRLRVSSPQDCKLLPKRHVFQDKVPATAKQLGQ
ncbi:MAG: hypothetical protein ABSF28_26145 [Terracidiphilus sp.]